MFISKIGIKNGTDLGIGEKQLSIWKLKLPVGRTAFWNSNKIFEILEIFVDGKNKKGKIRREKKGCVSTMVFKTEGK